MLKAINNRLKNKKGQSTLEYAILIVIIIGALLSIQVYIKRGVQGRLKQSTDDIGDQFSVGNQNAVTRTTTSSVTNQTFIGGVSRTELMENETTNVVINSEIIDVEQEFWGQSQ